MAGMVVEAAIFISKLMKILLICVLFTLKNIGRQEMENQEEVVIKMAKVEIHVC